MNPWTLAFIGLGVLLAALGASSIFSNWEKQDQELRQSGWIFFAAGLAMAAMTLFAATTLPHSH